VRPVLTSSHVRRVLVAAGVPSVPLNVSVSAGAAGTQMALVILVQTVIILMGIALNVIKIIARNVM